MHIMKNCDPTIHRVFMINWSPPYITYLRIFFLQQRLAIIRLNHLVVKFDHIRIHLFGVQSFFPANFADVYQFVPIDYLFPTVRAKIITEVYLFRQVFDFVVIGNGIFNGISIGIGEFKNTSLLRFLGFRNIRVFIHKVQRKKNTLTTCLDIVVKGQVKVNLGLGFAPGHGAADAETVEFEFGNSDIPNSFFFWSSEFSFSICKG